MDETYIRVKGKWRYLYRAVEKSGETVDFLLTEEQDQEAALRFLKRTIRCHGVPEKITIAGGEAHAAAIKRCNQEHGTSIDVCQVTYLNNIIAQDHRAVKWGTRSRLGCESFAAAQGMLVGIELMHMFKQGQIMGAEGGEGLTPAEQVYALAA